MSVVKMSKTAYEEFVKFLDKNNINEKTIRIYVESMGCSGPQFNIAVDDKNFDDISEQVGDITFIINGYLFKQAKGFQILCASENGTNSFTIEPFEKFGSSCGGNCGGCSSNHSDNSYGCSSHCH